MTHVRKQPECLVPKHPSDTWWSARADVSEAFYKGYPQFQSALQEISLMLLRIAAHDMKQMNWQNTSTPLKLP